MDLDRVGGKAFGANLAILEKMSDLATAAFGLVAALAWNAAIQSIFRLWFGDLGTAWAPLLGYAVVVTVIAVLVMLWVGRGVDRLKRLTGGSRGS